jgi:hypothetical protein
MEVLIKHELSSRGWVGGLSAVTGLRSDKRWQGIIRAACNRFESNQDMFGADEAHDEKIDTSELEAIWQIKGAPDGERRPPPEVRSQVWGEDE